MPVNDDARLAKASGLVSSALDDGVVVLAIESGHFFYLNQIGARIWEALEQPLSRAELCASLERKYKVDPGQCRADVSEFIVAMEERGLLQPA